MAVTDEVRARRVAIVQLSADWLIEILKPGRRCYEIVENALPADAKVIGAQYNALSDVWDFAVESESFDPVPLNTCLPLLPVIFVKALDHADA